jgi:hypothetical protein
VSKNGKCKEETSQENCQAQAQKATAGDAAQE